MMEDPRGHLHRLAVYVELRASTVRRQDPLVPGPAFAQAAGELGQTETAAAARGALAANWLGTPRLPAEVETAQLHNCIYDSTLAPN